MKLIIKASPLFLIGFCFSACAEQVPNLKQPLPRESTYEYSYQYQDYDKVVVKRNFRVFQEGAYFPPRYRSMQNIEMQADRPTMSNVFFKF